MTIRRFPVAAQILGVVLAGLYSTSNADRSISLPHEEHFDSSAWYADLPWHTQGGTVTRLEQGGWKNSGAVKITPPTVGQGYAGIGSFIGFGKQTQLNVRYLMNFGSSFTAKAPTGKQVIMNRTAGRNQGVFRPILQDNGNLRSGMQTKWFYPCLQILCTMHNPRDRFDQPFEVYANGRRANEWVSFELEADLTRKVVNLFIHTEDGKVRGLYASHDMNQQEKFNSADFPIVMIQGIGFFWHRADEVAPVETRDNNTYLLIDEVKIDNKYIGPPSGFVAPR